MLFALLFLALSLAAALGLPWLWGLSPWWGLALFPLSFALLNVLFLLFFYLIALRVDMSGPIEKQDPMCAACAAHVGRLMCAYGGVRPHFSGLDKLPEGRFLLVCNHRSIFDPLTVMGFLPQYRIAFISKPENLQIPMLGRIGHGAGYLPIDRENDRKALKTILTAADYIKRDYCSMGIYPEGTRSKTRQMLPFHHGSFKIAQRAHVPLVIAAVSGTDMVKKNALRRFTDVYIDILELIPAEEVRAKTTAELSDHAYAAIAEALEKREGKA